MMISRHAAIGAAAVLVVAAAGTIAVALGTITHQTQHATKPKVQVSPPKHRLGGNGTNGGSSTKANGSTGPPKQEPVQATSSTSDPAYFNPPTTGAGTGNSAIPIGNYFEFWPTEAGNYEAPGYFLNVTHSDPNGAFSGMMYLHYADGKVDSVFPFTGTLAPGGQSATFTVTGPPTTVSYNDTVFYVQAVVEPGDRLSATLTERTVTMEGCDTYLHFLTAAGGAPPNGLSSDPDLCNFYYMGGETWPNRSQLPITPAS